MQGDLKDRIKEHYDIVSPFYNQLWGEHIHHGYWISGDESKEKAQEQLTDLLCERADVKNGMKILDVGCGTGGSSIYLAKKYKAQVTGITISPKQIEIARNLAKIRNTDPQFLLMDAENMAFNEKFDLVWSIEALSHLSNQEKYFSDAADLLPSGGKFALTDWFKKADLSPEQEREFIAPIEIGMLLPHLRTMEEYINYMKKNDFRIIFSEDISVKVFKTWDICFDMLKDINLWKLALRLGSDFIAFMKSFQDMRKGYKSGNFVYGIIIAEKI